MSAGRRVAELAVAAAKELEPHAQHYAERLSAALELWVEAQQDIERRRARGDITPGRADVLAARSTARLEHQVTAWTDAGGRAAARATVSLLADQGATLLVAAGVPGHVVALARGVFRAVASA